VDFKDGVFLVEFWNVGDDYVVGVEFVVVVVFCYVDLGVCCVGWYCLFGYLYM